MTNCPHCGAPTPAEHRFCDKCGKPLDVDPALNAKMVAKLKQARGWILAAGILYTVSVLLILALVGGHVGRKQLTILLASNLTLTAIHIGLFIWARREPFAAAIVALTLFITVQVVNIAMDPNSITRGIPIKVLFIGALWQAIAASLAVRR